MAVTLSLTQTAAFVAAALLMVLAGFQKKRLAWRTAPRRCPVCGRTDRHSH